jgi:hypothetical protein
MMDDPLLRWVNQDVILGYGHADLHDCRDGQCQQGSVPGRGQSRRCNDQSINRLTVVVMRSAIISVSRLAYVVVD